jgi:phosphoribosylamine--glycine ligase/phosphoribosylformylglycinamidine cyclo-ligase
MMACVEGRLHETEVVMDDKSCAVVVIASSGYPGPYSHGKKIEIKPRQSSQGLICHCHLK